MVRLGLKSSIAYQNPPRLVPEEAARSCSWRSPARPGEEKTGKTGRCEDHDRRRKLLSDTASEVTRPLYDLLLTDKFVNCFIKLKYYILLSTLSQENESTYVVDEDPRETGWSEEAPQRTEHWVSGCYSCRYRVM